MVLDMLRTMAVEMIDHGHNIYSGYAYGVSLDILRDLKQENNIKANALQIGHEWYLGVYIGKADIPPIPVLALPVAENGYAVMAPFDEIVELGGVNPAKGKEVF